jgi:hypothetical protein
MLRGFELVSMSRAVAQVGVYARCAPQRPTGERAADRGDWVRVVSEEGPLEGPIRADHDHQQVPPALPAGPAGVCVKRLGSAPGCEAVRILTRLLLTIPPQPAHEHPPPLTSNRPIPCPTQQTHAIGLLVAQQHGGPFSAKDPLKEIRHFWPRISPTEPFVSLTRSCLSLVSGAGQGVCVAARVRRGRGGRRQGAGAHGPHELA